MHNFNFALSRGCYSCLHFMLFTLLCKNEHLEALNTILVNFILRVSPLWSTMYQVEYVWKDQIEVKFT